MTARDCSTQTRCHYRCYVCRLLTTRDCLTKTVTSQPKRCRPRCQDVCRLLTARDCSTQTVTSQPKRLPPSPSIRADACVCGADRFCDSPVFAARASALVASGQLSSSSSRLLPRARPSPFPWKRPCTTQVNEYCPPHTRVLGFFLARAPTSTRLKRPRTDQANEKWPSQPRVLGFLLIV